MRAMLHFILLRSLGEIYRELPRAITPRWHGLCSTEQQKIGVAMRAIRGILHPTDFCTLSTHAFQYACLLARHHHASIYILHVSTELDAIKGEQMSEPRSAQYLAEQWTRLEAIQAADVEIRRALEEGDPAEQIVRFAQTHPCDVIVMGTHGRSGFNRFVMGSVAEEVIRLAPCPVLTLKDAVFTQGPEQSSS